MCDNFIITIIITPFASAFTKTNESGGFIDGMKSLWYLISPPRDYYKPLLSGALDITKKGLVKRFEFKHKYKGNHSVGIFLNRFSKGDDFFAAPSQRYRMKLKMEINFYVKNSIVLSKVIKDYGPEGYGPFLSLEGGGLIFVFIKYLEIYRLMKQLHAN